MDHKEIKIGVGKRIREFAKQKFKTSRKLAEKLEMMPQTLQVYISGRALPGGEIVRKMAEIGADIHYIFTGENLFGKIRDEVNREMDSGGYRYPVVEIISTGSTLKFFNGKGAEHVAFNYYKSSGCMVLRIKGDIMKPTLEDGDLVLLDSEAELFDGSIAAAKLNSGKQVIGRLRNLPLDFIDLSPDNFSYEPVIINKNEINIIMPVVRIQRDVARKGY